MLSTSLQRVLRDARKLPRQTQAELAVMLLGASSLRRKTQKGNHKKSAEGLEALSGMSVDELRALANGQVASSRQRRLHTLLRKNKLQKLSVKEESELDKLVDECDHLALLKAKAMYTLSLINLS